MAIAAPRPSVEGSGVGAYDRFSGSERNQWLDTISAKINRALDPPPSPGPSRSPSPIQLQEDEDQVLQEDGESSEIYDEVQEESLDPEDEGSDGAYDEEEEEEDAASEVKEHQAQRRDRKRFPQPALDHNIIDVDSDGEEQEDLEGGTGDEAEYDEGDEDGEDGDEVDYEEGDEEQDELLDDEDGIEIMDSDEGGEEDREAAARQPQPMFTSARNLNLVNVDATDGLNFDDEDDQLEEDGEGEEEEVFDEEGWSADTRQQFEDDEPLAAPQSEAFWSDEVLDRGGYQEQYGLIAPLMDGAQPQMELMYPQLGEGELQQPEPRWNGYADEPLFGTEQTMDGYIQQEIAEYYDEDGPPVVEVTQADRDDPMRYLLHRAPELPSLAPPLPSQTAMIPPNNMPLPSPADESTNGLLPELYSYGSQQSTQPQQTGGTQLDFAGQRPHLALIDPDADQTIPQQVSAPLTDMIDPSLLSNIAQLVEAEGSQTEQYQADEIALDGQSTSADASQSMLIDSPSSDQDRTTAPHVDAADQPEDVDLPSAPAHPHFVSGEMNVEPEVVLESANSEYAADNVAPDDEESSSKDEMPGGGETEMDEQYDQLDEEQEETEETGQHGSQGSAGEEEYEENLKDRDSRQGSSRSGSVDLGAADGSATVGDDEPLDNGSHSPSILNSARRSEASKSQVNEPIEILSSDDEGDCEEDDEEDDEEGDEEEDEEQDGEEDEEEDEEDDDEGDGEEGHEEDEEVIEEMAESQDGEKVEDLEVDIGDEREAANLDRDEEAQLADGTGSHSPVFNPITEDTDESTKEPHSSEDQEEELANEASSDMEGQTDIADRENDEIEEIQMIESEQEARVSEQDEPRIEEVIASSSSFPSSPSSPTAVPDEAAAVSTPSQTAPSPVMEVSAEPRTRESSQVEAEDDRLEEANPNAAAQLQEVADQARMVTTDTVDIELDGTTSEVDKDGLGPANTVHREEKKDPEQADDIDMDNGVGQEQGEEGAGEEERGEEEEDAKTVSASEDASDAAIVDNEDTSPSGTNQDGKTEDEDELEDDGDSDGEHDGQGIEADVDPSHVEGATKEGSSTDLIELDISNDLESEVPAAVPANDVPDEKHRSLPAPVISAISTIQAALSSAADLATPQIAISTSHSAQQPDTQADIPDDLVIQPMFPHHVENRFSTSASPIRETPASPSASPDSGSTSVMTAAGVQMEGADDSAEDIDDTPSLQTSSAADPPDSAHSSDARDVPLDAGSHYSPPDLRDPVRDISIPPALDVHASRPDRRAPTPSLLDNAELGLQGTPAPQSRTASPAPSVIVEPPPAQEGEEALDALREDQASQDATDPDMLQVETPTMPAGRESTSPMRHHHGYNHEERATPTPPKTRSHARKSSVTPASAPPVTRSHCTYHKMRISDQGLSAVVLVPHCTLADREKVEKEHAEDQGEATRKEERSARKITEDEILLAPILSMKLHRIVGRTILEEGHVYLLHANVGALQVASEGLSSTPTKSHRKRQSEGNMLDSVMIDSSPRSQVKIEREEGETTEVDQTRSTSEGTVPPSKLEEGEEPATSMIQTRSRKAGTATPGPEPRADSPIVTRRSIRILERAAPTTSLQSGSDDFETAAISTPTKRPLTRAATQSPRLLPRSTRKSRRSASIATTGDIEDIGEEIVAESNETSPSSISRKRKARPSTLLDEAAFRPDEADEDTMGESDAVVGDGEESVITAVSNPGSPPTQNRAAKRRAVVSPGEPDTPIPQAAEGYGEEKEEAMAMSDSQGATADLAVPVTQTKKSRWSFWPFK